MSSKTVHYKLGCSGFGGVLWACLFTAKLIGAVNVSWLWVLLPIWIVPALLVTLAALAVAFVTIVFCVSLAAAILD